MDTIGLDFETYGDVDLPKHGLDRYINGPGFTPLMASIYRPYSGTKDTFDFILGGESALIRFMQMTETVFSRGGTFVAHNAGFERAVLRKMGVDERNLASIFDSAVIARCQGAASSLEASSAQLLTTSKLDTGTALIKKFSIPNDWNNRSAPTADLIDNDAQAELDWIDFAVYCEGDAKASVEMFTQYVYNEDTFIERAYEQHTRLMNETGWFVDLPLVHEMRARYEMNSEQILQEFKAKYDPQDQLNLASVVQLRKWCAERGIKTSSFDSDHVDRLISKLEKGMAKLPASTPQAKLDGYAQVLAMLQTKKALGGSSLSKLQKIIDLTSSDGRLRDQYLHAGAGQTYRTSGRGVQMQNLKRLDSDLFPMETLFDAETEADNETMAANLRQVFRAEHRDGRLVVGDFGSVESRGLAWLAGEDWKIESYRQGKDIYKVLASKFTGLPYEEITKEARAEGKYSELSCGYQAGGEAVKDFMHKLGFTVDLPGAEERVNNWREANPAIVQMWADIGEALEDWVDKGLVASSLKLANNLELRFFKVPTPDSLKAQHPGARSMGMQLSNTVTAKAILTRVFHGVYRRGRQICYYKPSDRKTGQLWRAHYVHPKTKKTTFYSIYGGKLSGILTQSLCREMFMRSLNVLRNTIDSYSNLKLVGQFHDEIVVEWSPSTRVDAISLKDFMKRMQTAMSYVEPELEGFPLTAEIKADWRYTK